MKKTLLVFAMAVSLMALSAVAVYAGGDKVHGENGQGSVVQNCIEPGDCPWN